MLIEIILQNLAGADIADIISNKIFPRPCCALIFQTKYLETYVIMGNMFAKLSHNFHFWPQVKHLGYAWLWYSREACSKTLTENLRDKN